MYREILVYSSSYEGSLLYELTEPHQLLSETFGRIYSLVWSSSVLMKCMSPLSLLLLQVLPRPGIAEAPVEPRKLTSFMKRYHPRTQRLS